MILLYAVDVDDMNVPVRVSIAVDDIAKVDIYIDDCKSDTDVFSKIKLAVSAIRNKPVFTISKLIDQDIEQQVEGAP